MTPGIRSKMANKRGESTRRQGFKLFAKATGDVVRDMMDSASVDHTEAGNPRGTLGRKFKSRRPEF